MHFPSVDKMVCVIIPCLNEETPIADVVREVTAQKVDEVIVVDNGSTDRTAERAAAAGARVVYEPRRGYGRACAAGVSALRGDAEIVCFLNGDGSDVPNFLPAIVQPIADGEADFVMGSRTRGRREPGSLTPQQLVAGWLAGLLLRLTYGVRFTDMSPFRAIAVGRLRALGMTEPTYGSIWKCRCARQRRIAESWRSRSITAAAAAVCRKCRAISPPGCRPHGRSSRPFCGSP